MIVRILVVLLCLGLATAPAVAADESGEGSCVWTSRDGQTVSAGVNYQECTSKGGSWDPDAG